MTAWWRSVQSSVDATCSRDDQRSSVKLHFEMLFNAISRAPTVQFSFFAVPPRSLHHRLKGRLRAPRSTQVLSTRSLGLLNFASEVGLSQHTV
jgi:hypothetical protein